MVTGQSLYAGVAWDIMIIGAVLKFQVEIFRAEGIFCIGYSDRASLHRLPGAVDIQMTTVATIEKHMVQRPPLGLGGRVVKTEFCDSALAGFHE